MYKDNLLKKVITDCPCRVLYVCGMNREINNFKDKDRVRFTDKVRFYITG